MGDYSQKVRDIAGQMNVLAKMASDDNTKRMGLHLFDKSY